MEALEIINAIKQRRNGLWDRQIMGDASDPLIYSEAAFARAMADEYDSLLSELGVK